MRLPNAETAIVDGRKLAQYLLSKTHSRGAAKAAFVERFGFDLDDISSFRYALIEYARDHEVSTTRETVYGTVFEVDGRIKSPDGRNPWLRVVWFLPAGQATQQLTTAFPSKSREP